MIIAGEGRLLTRVEHHFADDDPSCGEVQVQLEQTASSPVETDRDVPGVLQHQVGYIGVRQRLVLVDLAVVAKPDVRLGEYLRRDENLERNLNECRAGRDYCGNVFHLRV